MDVYFDLQTHLEAMEDRIRTDIKGCQESIVGQKIDHVGLEGRVKSLEEKTGWIFSGIATGLLGLAGTAWHVLTGKP